jgi:F-type H+-transporting ATPase subunit epsilon
MLPDSIELVIVTPERQLLRATAKQVSLPGADGCLGILPGHAPLITELGIGELSFQPIYESTVLPPGAGAKNQPEYQPESADLATHVAIIGGFAEVLGDRVSVLAETAERATEIDLARAERALKRAEERLSSGDPNIDWDRATVALQRAVIRIQVARKRRAVPQGT